MAKDCQKRKRKLVEDEEFTREDAIRESTNGGRALNAVWALPKDSIDSAEALILLYLGSKVNFSGRFTATQSKSIKTIATATKLSEDTVLRRSNSLVEKGYLKKHERFHSKTGKQLCNDFSITKKLFDEYADILVNRDRCERPMQNDKDRRQRVRDPLGAVH